MGSFHTLGLSPVIENAVAEMGFHDPTPIQEQSIPIVLKGHDLLGLAQTGTGKTAAFGLPLLDLLSREGKKPQPRHIRALILAPTRELVSQITEHLKGLNQSTKLRIFQVVGGVSINMQVGHLRSGADIMVATPGRLMDLIAREAVFLEDVRYLVLDEADQMLDLGFIHDLRRLQRMLPDDRQTLLFSATMPKQIASLSKSFQTDPKQVEIAPSGSVADRVRQSVHFVSANERVGYLADCLAKRPEAVALVFARTKRGAERLKVVMCERGLAAVSIHGNKTQGQRNRALEAFKSGEARILVATDVAARGIHIDGVTHVFNYDLPDVAETYIHRIGRTARAGAAGEAITFCRAVDIPLFDAIERLIGHPLPVERGERPSAGEVEAQTAESLANRRLGRGARDGKPKATPLRGKSRKSGGGAKRGATGEGARNKPAEGRGKKQASGGRSENSGKSTSQRGKADPQAKARRAKKKAVRRKLSRRQG